MSAIAISRGIAVDPSIPPGIRQGLAGEGLTPVDDVPKELKSETASGAAKPRKAGKAWTSFITDPADLASAAQIERQRHLGPDIAHDGMPVPDLDPLVPGFDRGTPPILQGHTPARSAYRPDAVMVSGLAWTA